MSASPIISREEVPLPRVLLVESNTVQVALLWRALCDAGFQTDVVSSGDEALESISKSVPDLVVTDLIISGMDGLQLIQTIRKSFPQVPVILLTEQGSEDVAAEALAKGAVSYIPKRYWETTLLHTIRNLIGLSRRPDLRHRNLLDSLRRTTSDFELDSRPSVAPGLVNYVCETLQLMQFGTSESLIRLCVALTEVLDNAVYHGNFELSSELRKGDGSEWHKAIAERLRLSPYKDRKVFVHTDLSRECAAITVRDEGPGFDHSDLPDPTDPTCMESPSGRGIFLVKAFMDEVHFNDVGNEVRLVSYRKLPLHTPFNDDTNLSR